eukprot:TRINITY_DN11866_c1_g2_i1.p2 TRINITY_DN11866_c1_g2~~TRINITY_DN11866_c1_g2_i1.p2  ORF type:complete len:172 (+),score=19.04 TRINITY_DN11866_c1_g2_i1:2111-2626(+)
MLRHIEIRSEMFSTREVPACFQTQQRNTSMTHPSHHTAMDLEPDDESRIQSTSPWACPSSPSLPMQPAVKSISEPLVASTPKHRLIADSKLAMRRGSSLAPLNTSLSRIKNTEDLREETLTRHDIDVLFMMAARESAISPMSTEIEQHQNISPVVWAELDSFQSSKCPQQK